jgi:hypothetical protein
MNCLNWEQLQHVANNMLANTDQPEELILLYLKKMYSLLLDAPKELHPYMIQTLRDTGMTNDPELKKLFNLDSFSQVAEMDMIESNGGYKSRKLNKRKNQSAGKPKKKTNESTTQGDDKLVLVNEESQGKFLSPIEVVILKAAERERKLMRIDLMERELRQSKHYEEYYSELRDLDDQLVKRKDEIKAKFDNDISNVWLEIGADGLFWIAGAALWSLFMNSPIGYLLMFSESGLGAMLFGPEFVYIFNFLIVGGLLGGLLKGYAMGNLSLEKYNPLDQPSKRGLIMSFIKPLLGKVMNSHPGLHALKLYTDLDKLPTRIDIFEIDEYKDYEDKIEKKKEELRLLYPPETTMLSWTSGRLVPFRKSSIVEVDDEPSFQQQIKDDQKKTNGGMKKISKKYLKKTRKSKY